MRVADLGLDPRIVEILKKQGIEELYPPQADAIGPALLGENLVLAIPTASGKSLVAYLAILASVLRGGKALYIVPLRALAAEKYEALKDFEPLGIKVGISVGDYDSADPTLEKLDVIVATSERADSLLRHRTNWLQRLSVVVADEVHLINDADRGPTLEVTLARSRAHHERMATRTPQTRSLLRRPRPLRGPDNPGGQGSGRRHVRPRDRRLGLGRSSAHLREHSAVHRGSGQIVGTRRARGAE